GHAGGNYRFGISVPLARTGERVGVRGKRLEVLPIHGEVAPKAPEGLAAELQAVGRLSRCRSRGVAWPNTRPCQGRERRFESGRDRHSRHKLLSVERWPSPVEGDGLENRYRCKPI